MKRIDIVYDGRDYSIGDQDLDALQARIDVALTTGQPDWLEVNFGEGQVRQARILIAPGVSISLLPVPPQD